MQRPAATIVILAWNAWDATAACLETLRPTLGLDDQVVVVDNGSRDATPDRLPAYRWIEVVTNEDNRGFAAGCNQGAAAARNDVVVFLNNDTLLSPGWLDGLLAPFADSSVVAAGPRSNFVSGRQLIEDAASYTPTSLSDIHDFAWTWTREHRGKVRETTRLVGFCMAVRRDAFDEIGGFDERFGIGSCEDDDLCLRLSAAGGRLLIVDDVFVHHVGHATFDANGVDWRQHERENLGLLTAMHGLGSREVPAPVRREPLPDLSGESDLSRESDAERPRVSVVIATLNRPKLLARALDSVAGQTLNDGSSVEVLVVNDGGRSVADVVLAFEGRLRVRLIDHEVNRGRSHAFNTGISHARAPFVALLADDDLWYPHHLAMTVEALEAGAGPTAVYSPAIKVIEDDEGNAITRELTGWQEPDREQLLLTNWICGITVVAPADALRQAGGFDPDLDVLEDWELWLQLAHLARWQLVPVPTAEYRVRQSGDNSTNREFFRFHPALLYVYERHPVPAGTTVAWRREQFVEQSRARAEAFGFDVSAVVACGDSLPATVTTLQSIAQVLAGGRWELVLLVPSVERYEPLLDALEGDLQVYAVGDVSAEQAWEFANRKACGRHVLRLRAGELANPSAVLEALKAGPGTAHEVGVPQGVPTPRHEPGPAAVRG